MPKTTAVLTLEAVLGAVSTIAHQIQSGLDVEAILRQAIAVARAHLQTDRVIIYRFIPDRDAVILFESVGRGWPAIVGQLIYDPCFEATWVDRYRQGCTTQINDVHDGSVSPCYVALLDRLHVKANLVVPLLNQGALWGLLIAHHCRSPRQWQPLEVQFLQSLALQLGIAIHQAELRQALAQSEQKHRDCDLYPFSFDSLAIPVVVIDRHGQILRVNDALCRSLGYSREELNGMTLAQIDPHFQADTLALSWPTFRQQKTLTFTSENRTRDGRLFPVEVTTQYVEFQDQEYAFTLVQDISDRKQAEAQLRESEERYRSVIATMSEGVVLQQADGQIMACNASAERILGLTPDQMMGKTSIDLDWCTIHEDGSPFPGDTHPAMITLRTGQPQSHVVMGICKGVEAITWISINSQPLFQSGATLPYAVVTSFADITELRQANIILRQQADREHLLIAIAQRIRQTLDLEEILKTTVQEVQQFLQTDRVLIYRFEPDWSGVVITESAVDGWESILAQQITDTYFVENQGGIYRLGEVKVTDDIYTANFSSCHVEFLEKWQVKALLVVPILQEDKLWGLLVAQQCRSPRQWQPLETELLQQLATQIAIAIHQSELYEEVQLLNTALELQVGERTAQLQQALDLEATLKRITDLVRDSLDEGHILQTVVRELAIAMQAECCDTAIYSADRTVSTIQYEYSEGETRKKNWSCAIAESSDPHLYSQLFQGRECHFCLNSQNVLRPEQLPYTVLACPIMDDQGILGDLWLFRSAHTVFNDLEIRLVQQVANQCAIALRQSRLYQAAQAQVQELERLNQLKDDFLSTVSHELRTPMSNIKMATQMLEISLQSLGVFDNDHKGTITRYFKVLCEEGQREINLINDLLDLTRLDAGVGTELKDTIVLQHFIPYLAEPFVERARNQKQHLEIKVEPDLPAFRTHTSYLERIVAELLNNACKYTPPGEVITICAQRVSSGLAIQVCNSGVDVPAAECDRIFDKFYRIPNSDPWKYGGTGLGLTLVKKLMEQLGGTIGVESRDRCLCFTLQFPM